LECGSLLSLLEAAQRLIATESASKLAHSKGLAFAAILV
jgi:hypothetical protein